jgi:uncharacterized protein
MKGIKTGLLVCFLLTLSSLLSAQNPSDLLHRANAGNREAQYQLGMNYYYGNKVEADPNAAKFWMEKAALQGHPDARGQLGYMYYKGTGVEQNYEKSFYWYHKSAEAGVDFAQHSLAYLYEKALGVEKDLQEAIFWYRKSVAQGYESSKENLCVLLFDGHAGSDAYPEALRLLKELLEKDSDNDEYQYRMAIIYYEGMGVEQDLREAFKWMLKSAENEHIDAQYELANMYFNGIGTEQDSAMGEYWYEIAEENESYYWAY